MTPTPKQQEAAEFRAITAMAAESAGYSEDIVRKVVNEEHKHVGEDAHRSNGKTTTTAFVANFDDYEYDRKKRAAKRIPDSELEKGGKREKAAFDGIEYQRQTQVSQESSLSTSFDAREMLQHYDSQKQSSTSSGSADFRTGQLAGFGTDRATKQTRYYSEKEQEYQSAAARFEAPQQLQRQDGQWTQFTTSPIMPVGFDHEQRYEQERRSTGTQQARLVRTERQQENRAAISPASTAFDARELLQRYDSVQQSLEASQQLQRQDGQWTQFTTSPTPSWGFEQQQQQQKQHYEHDRQSAGRQQTGFEETERQHQHGQEIHTSASHVSTAFDARELVRRNDSQETQVSDRVAIQKQEGPSRYSDHSTSLRVEKTRPSAARVDATQNFEQECRSSSQFDATQQLQNQDGQWTQASTSPTLPWGFDQQAQELYRQERRSAQVGTVGQDEHQMDTVQIKQYQKQQRQTQTADRFSSAAQVEERPEHQQQDFVATSPVSTAFDARQLLQNYDIQRQSLEASQQLQRQDGQWTQFTTSPAPSWGFDQRQQQKSQHAVPSTPVGLEAGPIVQYQEPRQDHPLELVKPEPLSANTTAPAGLAISQQQEEDVAISPVSTAFDARRLLQRYDSVQQSLEASQQLQRQDGQWTQFTTSPAPSWGFDQQQQKSQYVVPSTSAGLETGLTQFAGMSEAAQQYHERPSVFGKPESQSVVPTAPPGLGISQLTELEDRQEEEHATTSPVSTAFDARQLLQRYDSVQQSLEASQPLQRQDGQWTQFTTSPAPSWGFDQQQQQQKSRYIVPSTSAEVETSQTQFAVSEVARQYQERASVFSESESQSVVPTAPAGLGISQPTGLETRQGEEEHATTSPVSTAFDARQLLQRYDSVQQSLEASQPLQGQDGQWTQFTTSPAPSWEFDQQQQQQKSQSEHAQRYQKTHQERPPVVMPESQSAASTAPAGLAISQQTGLEVRKQEEHVATSPVSTAFDARQLLQRYDSQHRSFEASQQLQRQDGQWTQFTTSPMLPLEGDAFQRDGQGQQRQTTSQTTSSTKVNTLQDYSRPSTSSELRLGQQHRNEQRHEQQRHQILQEQEYSSVESSDEEEQRYEDTVEEQEANTGLGLRGGYLHRRDRHRREFAETTEKRKKERRSISASREVSQKKTSSRDVETVSSESVESTQQQKQSHREVTAVAQSVKGRVSTQEATQSRQYDEKRRDGYRETSQQQATTERLPYVSQETKSYDASARYEQTTGTTAYVSMPSPATGGYITQLATPIEQWTSGGYLASVGAPPYGAELSQTKFEQCEFRLN